MSEELRQKLLPLAQLRAVFRYKPEPTLPWLESSTVTMVVDSPEDEAFDATYLYFGPTGEEE